MIKILSLVAVMSLFSFSSFAGEEGTYIVELNKNESRVLVGGRMAPKFKTITFNKDRKPCVKTKVSKPFGRAGYKNVIVCRKAATKEIGSVKAELNSEELEDILGYETLEAVQKTVKSERRVLAGGRNAPRWRNVTTPSGKVKNCNPVKVKRPAGRSGYRTVVFCKKSNGVEI